jgi:hypothetical protein
MDYYRDDLMVLRLLGLKKLPDVSTVSRALATMDATGILKLRSVVPRDAVDSAASP